MEWIVSLRTLLHLIHLKNKLDKQSGTNLDLFGKQWSLEPEIVEFSDFSFLLLFSKDVGLEAFWLCPYWSAVLCYVKTAGFILNSNSTKFPVGVD